jgi:hypothetical protein
LPEQVGAGALDLGGTLQALDAGDLERTPGTGSELIVSASYAHPDPTWPLTGLLELRDDAGNVVDGFDASRLALAAAGATVLEPLTQLAPGLWQFAVAAASGSGGRTLTLAVTFDGQVVAAKELPIAVDRANAGVLPSARGGCALVPAERGVEHAGWLALLAALAVARRRRPRRAWTDWRPHAARRCDAGARLIKTKKERTSWFAGGMRRRARGSARACLALRAGRSR